ncbi:DUF1481 domain-containing protein [Vibrio gallicus]|uniref:DUF1481 domain-containing protein n=1 Tax=Vibrio gallicus TaxID=190897 RepID=UPI0021C33270|nr:DUF1481 domain-containing protein [Vibrio gallicus]
MKHVTPVIFVTLVLAGCSSATTPLRQNAQITQFAGGESNTDRTSFYWLTEKLNNPESSTDDVKFADNTWYQSHYTWDGNYLREITRVGERRNNSGDKVPFQMTLRFSQAGEAVYQRMQINGRVMPMKNGQIGEVRSQAGEVVSKSRSQRNEGLSLIQGHWKDGVFTTCNGDEYRNIQFKQPLPKLLVDRIKEEENFAAFIGELGGKKIVVDQMLLLKHGGYACIERPMFNG